MLYPPKRGDFKRKIFSSPGLIMTSLIFLSFFSCNHEKSLLIKNLERTGKVLTDHLLSSPNFMKYETKELKSIHYAEVCAAYGAIKYACAIDDKKLIKKLMKRYDELEQDSLAWQDHHVDGNVYGILPFQFFEITGEPAYLNHGLFLADNQWDSLNPTGITSQARYWIDDVFMISALQVEAYKATEMPMYLDRAAQVTAAYIDSLQQSDGLFFHGPNAPIYWGRGNGWMAVGMAITLTELPIDHPQYTAITSGYAKMMEALLKYQSDEGLWRQVIDYPEAWEETSSTAMFAYAMNVGINRGILPKEKYKKAVHQSYEALKSRINKKGELTGVCVGTGQSTDIQYYLDRPTVDGDFHGQAPMLWLIESMILTDER